MRVPLEARGQWVPSDQSTPYSYYTVPSYYTSTDYAACGGNVSYFCNVHQRWGWQPSVTCNATVPMDTPLSGRELCEIVPRDARIVIYGDSLSQQFCTVVASSDCRSWFPQALL
jgi:hypothetical protein